MTGCIFCAIVAGEAEAERLWVLRDHPNVVGIVPLNPVTPGHVLVIPRRHVLDALEDPAITAMTMHVAAQIAGRPCNIITSAGAEATQTVLHLHVHIVPRSAGDGLALPWTGQK